MLASYCLTDDNLPGGDNGDVVKNSVMHICTGNADTDIAAGTHVLRSICCN